MGLQRVGYDWATFTFFKGAQLSCFFLNAKSLPSFQENFKKERGGSKQLFYSAMYLIFFLYKTLFNYLDPWWSFFLHNKVRILPYLVLDSTARKLKCPKLFLRWAVTSLKSPWSHFYILSESIVLVGIELVGGICRFPGGIHPGYQRIPFDRFPHGHWFPLFSGYKKCFWLELTYHPCLYWEWRYFANFSGL